MNNEILIYGIIGLVVLLIIVIIIIIATFSGGNKKTAPKTVRKNEPLRLVHIQSIELPKQVESISKREIHGIVSKILRVYEKLDYNTNKGEFMKAQWHTWQVSLIMKLYKAGQGLHVYNPEKIFPVELLQRSDKDLRQLVNDILNKYKRDVDPHRNRDFLSREVIWSGRDVAILFLFLSRYEDFPMDLR